MNVVLVLVVGQKNPVAFRRRKNRETKNDPRCRSKHQPAKIVADEPSPAHFHEIALYLVSRFNDCLLRKTVTQCAHEPEFGEVGAKVRTSHYCLHLTNQNRG